MEFKLRNADKKSVWHEKFVAILIYYLSKKLNTVGFSGANSKLSVVRNPDLIHFCWMLEAHASISPS